MLRLSASILKQLSCLLLAVACLAQSPAQSPKLPAANVPDADVDSPDIPPFARGRISEQQYLELRDQQLRLQRGVNYLMLDPTARSRAINQMQLQELMGKMRPSLNSSLPALVPSFAWTPLGPDPIPNGQTGTTEVPVSGRVTAIAVDPNNENIVYVGAAQGGLYRSMDGGATWTALMDSAQSLAIGAITIDPTDHNTLFVGTGEGNLSLDSFFGVGLYIIQNATTTANLFGPFNLDGTGADVFTGRAITQIIVNPTDHNKILVSSSSGFSGASGDVFNKLPARGVFLSTNALSGNPTFTRQTIQPAVANRAVTDMVMDPGNASTIVVYVFGLAAAGDGGIWVSTAGDPWSGTATWKQATLLSANTKFGVNRAGNPASTTFYAMFDEVVSCAAPAGATAEGGLSKSIDGGMTWTPLPAATGFCGGQCFYDMTMAVDSTSGNIFLGGSAGNGTGSCASGILGESTDGGASFKPSQNFLHADSHATVIAPGDHTRMYAGNDGGIFKSVDSGATWQSINTAGFTATQFESLSVHPTDPNFTIGGTQDNGTEFMKPDGTWTRADFGDGGFSGIDQNATDTTNVTMYHTYFNVTNDLVGFAQVTSVSNATEGNWNFFGCGGTPNGINCGDDVLFYAPLALGPGSPNTVYFGTDHLYRSTNQGATMTPASQVFAVGNPVSAIGISPQDDNVRLVGLVDGQVFATTTGANPMTEVTGGWTPLYVARTVIDPNNKSTAYVTLDGYGTPNHVWKTTNLTGTPPTATWASASSGLPDVPVNAFAIDPLNSSYLYAGTDIGVFLSTDGGNSWNPYGTGLPRVAVFDLNIQPTSRKVRIGTHGRGAWEVIASPFTNTTTVTASPTSVFFGNSVTLTAQINQGGGVKVPTGTISFEDGTTSLGSAVTVDGTGKATLQAGVLAQGAHNITAQYSGDSLYFGSNGALALTVQAPDYTITIPNGTATVPAGNSASYTITISPEGSFTSAVNFTCAGLPQAASCSFTPGTVTPNGGPASTTLMISTTARMTQNAAIPSGLLTGAGFFGLVLVSGLSSRRTRKKAFFMAVSLLALAMILISCGGGGHNTITTGTPAGAFNVSISATSGNISHQSTVTLNVQ